MTVTSPSTSRVSARAYRLLAAAALACAAITVTTPPAAPAAAGQAVSAAQRARADLVVSKGAVRVAGGRATGSFTVRNRGGAGAGRSLASLSLRVAGRNRGWRRFAVPAVRRSASRVIRVTAGVPSGLPAGVHPIRACANSGRRVRESSTRNNCRSVGAIVVAARPAPVPPAPPVAPPPVPAPPLAPLASTVPTAPLEFTKSTPMAIGVEPSNYWFYVPDAYDTTHATPMTLFVWLHGCSGFSAGDIYKVSGVPAQSYIAVAPGGREGGCWDVNSDPARVLATIADVKTHFNINPRRVILGGYSSGGDLAYRTAFYNSRMFAGVLATNTAPFKDTGSSPAASIAAASWKFHIVHLAHIDDAAYPIDTVRAETNYLLQAGFPIQRIERQGIHYEPDTATTGTDHDTRTLLLPHLDDGWLAPPP